MEDLLFLAHRIPYPPNKGDKIRAWHFLRHLAGRYRVHLAFFIDDPEDARFVPKLEEICASVCWRPLVPWRAKIRGLLGLLSGEPLTQGYFHDRLLRSGIDRLIVQHRPERFFIFSSAMAPYLEHHKTTRCVLDMVDVDSEKWRSYASVTSGLVRCVYAREARTLLALERRATSNADVALFVSRAEADLFRVRAPETAAHVCHISNGVDTAYFDPALDFSDPFAGAPAIVFVGAMDYRPNQEAVAWFATEVMPLLRSSDKPLTFWIVGANPSAGVRHLAKVNVYVTGRVTDIRPYLAHAAAVVAPLRMARGIQNKVLEAMAMAVPAIVTPQAREGLEACRDDELIEASGAEAFADAIRRVLAGDRATIGRRARERILQDFSWQPSLAALDALLDPDHLTGREGADVRLAPDPHPLAIDVK